MCGPLGLLAIHLIHPHRHGPLGQHPRLAGGEQPHRLIRADQERLHLPSCSGGQFPGAARADAASPAVGTGLTRPLTRTVFGRPVGGEPGRAVPDRAGLHAGARGLKPPPPAARLAGGARPARLAPSASGPVAAERPDGRPLPPGRRTYPCRVDRRAASGGRSLRQPCNPSGMLLSGSSTSSGRASYSQRGVWRQRTAMRCPDCGGLPPAFTRRQARPSGGLGAQRGHGPLPGRNPCERSENVGS